MRSKKKDSLAKANSARSFLRKALPFLQQNNFPLVLFLLSTSFFLYQYAVSFSWDFSAYQLNAQYWTGHGTYFELIRPPFTPFLLFLLTPLGHFAPYFYLILISVFFFYATYRFAQTTRISFPILYAFLLTPYALLYSTFAGTELLSLALLELFIIALITRRTSGIWLGLSSLTRYNSFIYFPFLFLEKNIKNIARNIFFFILALLPWLLYNYLAHGNLFASIADAHALNVRYRSDISLPLNFQDFFFLFTYLLPFFLLGILFFFKKAKKNYISFKTFITTERAPLLLFLFLLFSFLHYLQIPLREPRYLYPLILPIAYFSTLGVLHLCLSFQKVLSSVALFLLLITTISYPSSFLITPQESYQHADAFLTQNNLDHCRLFSNAWVPMNVLGKITEPLPHHELFSNYINRGNHILFFYDPRASIAGELFTYPILAQTPAFLLLGKKSICNAEQPVTISYLQRLQTTILLLHNQTINTNPCFVLFEHKKILERSCNLLNLNGFTLDENRISA